MDKEAFSANSGSAEDQVEFHLLAVGQRHLDLPSSPSEVQCRFDHQPSFSDAAGILDLPFGYEGDFDAPIWSVIILWYQKINEPASITLDNMLINGV